MSYICTPKESLYLIALTKRAAEKRPNKYNMEAKEAIVKIIKALLDIEEPTQRQLLIDYLMGRRSRQIEELGLSDKETFGIGESHDEDYWSTVIDAAYEGELLKQMASKKNALTPPTAGKKFAKPAAADVIIPSTKTSPVLKSISTVCPSVAITRLMIGSPSSKESLLATMISPYFGE